MAITVAEFGKNKAGETVKQYTIENANGMKAVVLNLGAILKELHVPDKDGKLRDVVWGYEDAAHYEIIGGPYFGAIVGRNANRIGKAQVEINGKTCMLDQNDNENCLHSGKEGYNYRMWKAIIADDNKVEFSLDSPDGDQGFPGNAQVTVSYKLTNDNELQISYWGKADQDTVFNMTNHSYFNLEGQESESILDQEVCLCAEAFTPTDAQLIPTGEIRPVAGTPMDFRKWKAVGAEIGADYEPMKLAGGYDHNFVLMSRDGYELAAKMRCAKSGIQMEVYTDLPGIQMYTACMLDEKEGGKNGRAYGKYSASCFETQYFPDALHHENFPSPLVKAGEEYRTTTGYKFTIA
ncbi:MAG: galactose mutarotase [Lachnospiraceae bacterium]|nr:galactose mutarotase [Lachnospiraceae bacterium]